MVRPYKFSYLHNLFYAVILAFHVAENGRMTSYENAKNIFIGIDPDLKTKGRMFQQQHALAAVDF